MPILGFGGSQVIITSLVIAAIAMLFLPWQQALAIGLILSLSSTAIVLQTLQEKGQMKTEAGESIFSVLLFQDLAVIPMLAILPLLATLTIASSNQHQTVFFDLHSLPNYLQLLITAGAIVFILVAGKYACRPVFRAIANTGIREIFVAVALALVIGSALLMILVGLSPALGAFLAGVVLADSEYRHELESDIEPFKGLLLGIFFISIGASLNFILITEQLWLIMGLTLSLMAVKWMVLLLISAVFNISKKERSLFAVALAQGGEFAFVLFQLTKNSGVLPETVLEPLISAVAISMFLTPIVFLIHDKLNQADVNESTAPEQDAISPADHKVILAGFGRLGTDVGRFLLSAGIKPVILDYDSNNVSVLRKLGFEVYFGDATRLDLLEAAGAAQAELLIITLGDIEQAKQLVELAQKHYPQLKILVNANDREASFELMDLGINSSFRKTFGTALSMGKSALVALGVDAYKAHRLMHIFEHKDQAMVPELYQKRCEAESYISAYKQHHQQLEQLMIVDNQETLAELDKAWTAKNPEL